MTNGEVPTGFSFLEKVMSELPKETQLFEYLWVVSPYLHSRMRLDVPDYDKCIISYNMVTNCKDTRVQASQRNWESLGSLPVFEKWFDKKFGGIQITDALHQILPREWELDFLDVPEKLYEYLQKAAQLKGMENIPENMILARIDFLPNPKQQDVFLVEKQRVMNLIRDYDIQFTNKLTPPTEYRISFPPCSLVFPDPNEKEPDGTYRTITWKYDLLMENIYSDLKQRTDNLPWDVYDVIKKNWEILMSLFDHYRKVWEINKKREPIF